MQFESYEQRHEAIKRACIELGAAHGNIKFKEQMFKEITQSFVKGGPEQGKIPESTEEIPKGIPEEKPVKEKKKPTRTKTASKKVKAEEVDEMAVEETTVEEVTEEVTEECPITSVDDLREYLTERYSELGGTQEVRGRLVAALTEATGKKQAKDVTEDQFAVAYAAIKEVK